MVELENAVALKLKQHIINLRRYVDNNLLYVDL